MSFFFQIGKNGTSATKKASKTKTDWEDKSKKSSMTIIFFIFSITRTIYLFKVDD